MLPPGSSLPSSPACWRSMTSTSQAIPAVYHPILLCGLGALSSLVAVRVAGRAGGRHPGSRTTPQCARGPAGAGHLDRSASADPLPLVAPVLDLALWRLSLIFGRRGDVRHRSRTWPAALSPARVCRRPCCWCSGPIRWPPTPRRLGPDALALATFLPYRLGAGGALAARTRRSADRYVTSRRPAPSPAPRSPGAAGVARPPARRPLPSPSVSRDAPVSPAPPARTSAAPLVAVALAFAGLSRLVAIFPALGNSGKPAWLKHTVRRNVVGTLELSPPCPSPASP